MPRRLGHAQGLHPLDGRLALLQRLVAPAQLGKLRRLLPQERKSCQEPILEYERWQEPILSHSLKEVKSQDHVNQRS
jgi:hypothetical protein